MKDSAAGSMPAPGFGERGSGCSPNERRGECGIDIRHIVADDAMTLDAELASTYTTPRITASAPAASRVAAGVMIDAAIGRPCARASACDGGDHRAMRNACARSPLA